MWVFIRSYTTYNISLLIKENGSIAEKSLMKHFQQHQILFHTDFQLLLIRYGMIALEDLMVLLIVKKKLCITATNLSQLLNHVLKLNRLTRIIDMMTIIKSYIHLHPINTFNALKPLKLEWCGCGCSLDLIRHITYNISLLIKENGSIAEKPLMKHFQQQQILFHVDFQLLLIRYDMIALEDLMVLLIVSKLAKPNEIKSYAKTIFRLNINKFMEISKSQENVLVKKHHVQNNLEKKLCITDHRIFSEEFLLNVSECISIANNIRTDYGIDILETNGSFEITDKVINHLDSLLSIYYQNVNQNNNNTDSILNLSEQNDDFKKI
ncbi:unnamed protein product [Rotaria sp. Silwood1]|nr:unnamed protein product [Rotaria sp. Silwood1]